MSICHGIVATLCFSAVSALDVPGIAELFPGAAGAKSGNVTYLELSSRVIPQATGIQSIRQTGYLAENVWSLEHKSMAEAAEYITAYYGKQNLHVTKIGGAPDENKVFVCVFSDGANGKATVFSTVEIVAMGKLVLVTVIEYASMDPTNKQDAVHPGPK